MSDRNLRWFSHFGGNDGDDDAKGHDTSNDNRSQHLFSAHGLP